MAVDINSALAVLSDPTLAIEKVANTYWARLLERAVETCLRETCFMMYSAVYRQYDANERSLWDTVQPGSDLLDAACDHADCLEFWHSLPLNERVYRFYCLGAPSYCSSCGERINSVVFAKDERLLKNACPGCGNVREDTRLPRDDWWLGLADAAGRAIAAFGGVSGGVMTGLIGRLAQFYVRGRLLAFSDTPEGRGSASAELWHILWDRFPDYRSTCYEAARWAVWQEAVERVTNTKLDDVPLTMRAAMLPGLIKALDKPEIAKDIVELARADDLPYQNRLRALRGLGRNEREPHEAPERAAACRWVFGDMEFLVIKINGGLENVRSHLHIAGDYTMPPDGDYEWLRAELLAAMEDQDE